MTTRYTKLEIALRYYLKGARYNTALKALDFGSKWHRGFRKDGITKEFQHQIEIALYCITLKGLVDEEKTITTALLHDVLEDYPESEGKFLNVFDMDTFNLCDKLNKNGLESKHYFSVISKDPIASIVKGADRIHNVNSMVGVFTKEKQGRYIKEVTEYFLPMLKEARKAFPSQMDAYANIMHMLRSQINLLGGSDV